MSQRAYLLMLAICVVVGIGLTALLVRWQGRLDVVTTASRMVQATRADRDQLAQQVVDLRAQLAALEAQLHRAEVPVMVPIFVTATQDGRVVCVAGGQIWPSRWDGTCVLQDRPVQPR